MKKEYVLFIDSGVGGLSLLAKAMPFNQNYLYFADNKFAPYGNLPAEFLMWRLENIISNLKKKYKINLVVLACNTATVTSIAHLRNVYGSTIFIGSEPAVKLALKNNFKSPLIIATKATIDKLSISFPNLAEKHQLLAVPDFAKNIENYLLKPTALNRFQLIKDIIYIKLNARACDCIVLGCTHYVLIKNLISKYINLPLIDGNDGIIQNFSSKLTSKHVNLVKKNRLRLLFSQQNKGVKQIYQKIFQQTLANKTNV